MKRTIILPALITAFVALSPAGAEACRRLRGVGGPGRLVFQSSRTMSALSTNTSSPLSN